MPLHAWTNPAGWEGVHHQWISYLLHWIKPRLPADYRAYIGSTPALAVGALAERPDLQVRQWLPEPPPELIPQLPPDPSGAVALPEPDIETATLTLDPNAALFVTTHGRLVAAVQLNVELLNGPAGDVAVRTVIVTPLIVEYAVSESEHALCKSVTVLAASVVVPRLGEEMLRATVVLRGV